MAHNEKARILAEAMLKCFKEDIAPCMPAESGYSVAMMRKALSITAREFDSDCFSDGRNEKSKEIRNRKYDSDSEAVSELLELVRKELAVNSPEFLKTLDHQIGSLGRQDWVFKPWKLLPDD